MGNRAVVSAVGFSLLVAVLTAMIATRPSTSGARLNGTADLTTGHPANATPVVLFSGISYRLPTTPALFALEQITLVDGAQIDLHPASGPELVYVDSGEVMLIDEIELTGPYGAGQGFLFGVGMSYGIQNASGAEATVLHFRLVPEAQARPVGNATWTPLILTSVTALPVAPACVFLAEMTWNATPEAEDHFHAGPVGFFATDGTLIIARTGGITGELSPATPWAEGPGHSVVIPANMEHQEWSAADSTPQAAAYVAAVIAIDQYFTLTADSSESSTPVTLDCDG